MTRPHRSRSRARLAGAVSTALLAASAAAAGGSAAAAAEEEETDTPLAVSMDGLTPSVIPRRGPITVSGEVTNRSEETWLDLQVYLLTSAAPIGDAAALAEAAASDPATEVGGRLATEGLFTEIGDLAPGESTDYTVTVRRADLEISGEPGVYWIGVHVLGAGAGARDGVADGRARAFVPLVPPQTARVKVALTVPLRQQVNRDPAGRLLGLERWQQALGPGGRLQRLLAFASTSRRPLTWVVDPALLDAATSVATENPPLSTDDDGSGAESEDPAPSDDPSPTAEESEPLTEPDEADEADEVGFAAQQAAGWLERFRRQARLGEVRAVPYGDLDVAAATNQRFVELVARAHRLSSSAMARLGVASRPVVAPPTGYLPGRALARLEDTAPVLIQDLAMPQAEGVLLTRLNGVDVALVDSTASSGGPGPNDPAGPLAIRQRILAEAALDALGGEEEPLLVSLPEQWDPGEDWRQARFFAGLDVPWLRQVGLDEVLAAGPGARDTTLPVYPRGQRRAQVPFANLVATRELARTGNIFATLLTDNDSVGDQLAQAAMLTSSYAARSHPGRALARARSTQNQVRLTMSRVVIEGPTFVMMSSTTGTIDLSLVNNLTAPVTVRLEAVTGNQLDIRVPDTYVLEPGQRTPVRMAADAADIGVRSVLVRATTVEGEPVGTEVRFNVRTSNVGLVIWLVMGGGGALFLIAIAARVWRRVQTRRATPGPLLGEAS